MAIIIVMENTQENRIAVIGIIVEDKAMAESVNTLLHQYSDYVIGRMGLPYRERNMSIISVVVDAPSDIIFLQTFAKAA